VIKPDLEGVRTTLQKYPFPVDVIVEVTRHCNLRCIMCPYPKLKRARGEMGFETFRKIADEVAMENPSTRIWLAIMGEPLLVKDRLFAMIRYAKDRGLQEINLNTNAVYMTGEVSGKLIESGVDKILVSIDAATQKTYDGIRVGGNFEIVVSNVENMLMLKKAGKLDKPEIIAQFIVMDENESEVESFKQYWLDKGAVVKIRPKLGWGDAVESKILNIAEQNTDRFPCSWLTRTVSIHWDGSFAQCDADHEGLYSPGDFNKQTIKELWDGEIARRRERHWALDFDFEPCKHCKDWLAGRSYFYYPAETA